MISTNDNTGGRPAAILRPPGREFELILDATKYKVIAVLIPRRIKHLDHVEIAYALGGGVWSDCKQIAAAWNCWAVLCDPAWAEEQLKSKTPRPVGAKVFFVT